MSLVNLAHVCSHLQNASLARLGLTSIPYTKLHLSVALLLQRQGFFSQVKLGGPSPPASCFGNGPADNHHVSNHLHSPPANPFRSPEAALAFKVHEGATRERLQRQGFDEEAVAFAEKYGNWPREHLVKDAKNWNNAAVGLALHARAMLEQQLRDPKSDAVDPSESSTVTGDDLETYNTASASSMNELDVSEPDPFPSTTELASSPSPPEEVLGEEYLAARATAIQELSELEKEVVQETLHLSPKEIASHEFSYETLLKLAGRDGIRNARSVEREGITLEAMGQTFTNQPIVLPRDGQYDLKGLDVEGVITQANRASRRLWIGLKYHDSMPVLSKAKMVSKPTKRVWLDTKELSRIIRGQAAKEVKGLREIGEVLVISTDRGLMDARECVERQIGGQPLIRVW